MFKKMTVLAMAVGVVAALALPASASAFWGHNGQLQVDKTLSVTGNVEFTGQLGGVKCQITSEVQFLAKSTTGTAKTFDVHPGDETQNCVGQGGIGPCQIHNVTPQAPNWQIHTEAVQTVTKVQGQQTVLGSQFASGIRVTSGTIQSQTTGGIFCLVKEVVLHTDINGHKVGLIEHNGGQDGVNVSELEVTGTALATITTNSGTLDTEEVHIVGTLQIEDPNDRNTYDI
jgi:hypothetical protein